VNGVSRGLDCILQDGDSVELRTAPGHSAPED
jgi:hypothetical protein